MSFSVSDHNGETIKVIVETSISEDVHWFEFDNYPTGRMVIFTKNTQELINLKNKIHWAFEKWERGLK